MDEFAGVPFVGFGANMNPYLFCRPNWGKGGVNEENAADLEKKIIELAPQHVRIFFLNSWSQGVGDQFASKGDPRTYASFLRTVRIAAKAGATVNVTLFFDPDRWADPASHARLFAHNLARMLRDDHLHAIRYITIQNEPDGNPPKGKTNNITLPKYVKAYEVFDRILRKEGLRDRVKIIAGDLLSDHQPEWVRYLGPHLAHIADGYSIHGYWNYWQPQRLLWRLNTTEREFGALPPAEQRPLYITEFGTRGHQIPTSDPGLYYTGQPIAMNPIQGVENASFMLKAVNDGFISLVQWDMYDAHYDVLMHYGLIGQAAGGWPLKPGYFLMKLMTHTCHPGWRAVRVDGKTRYVTAAAMKSDNGQMTLWAVNHAPRPSVARFSGLEAGKSYHLIYWNNCGGGELCDAGEVRTDLSGDVSVYMPFQSVIAVTTLPTMLSN
ncbi:MAG TPA: hypothetical protein VG722_07880 [Tepidisphaeraceae bacterium]|nr:hypothetical protein [Tepidisphaeraceae bacterium]